MKKILLPVLLLLFAISLYGVEINVRNKEALEDRGNISNQIYRTVNISLHDTTLEFNQIIARSGNRILYITYKGEKPDTNKFMWLEYKEGNTYGLLKMGIYRELHPKQFLGTLITGDPEGMAVFYGAEQKVASDRASSIAYKGRQGNYGVYDRNTKYPLFFSFNKIKFNYDGYNEYRGLGYLPMESKVTKANGDILRVRITKNPGAIAIDFNKWFDFIHEQQKNEVPN